MTTGERIKAARINAGLTQRELADRLNVSFVNISQWERGRRSPKIETLQKIASALNVPLIELFPEEYGMKYLQYEEIASDIKQDMMDAAPTWEEYEEARKTKVSEIQRNLVLADMERSRLNNLQSAFLRLNETGQKIAVEYVVDLAKIP